MPTPRSERSILWLHVEVAVTLTPWTWRLSAWRNGRDISLHAGPISLTAIDG